MLDAEKRAIVRSLLTEKPDICDSQVVQIFDCEPNMVAQIRKELGNITEFRHKTLRSDFLVHWTGRKKIEKEYRDPESADHNDNHARRDKYVQRLRDILVRSHVDGGLWMNDVEMKLHDSRGELITLAWPATCFTEIKLSSVMDHAKRYGFLGIGFSRLFAIERLGAPVLYLPGEKELRAGATICNVSQQLARLFRVMSFLEDRTVERLYSVFPHRGIAPRRTHISVMFDDFIRRAGLTNQLDSWGYSKARPPWAIFSTLRASVQTCAIFVKEMSDDDCQYKFELLDEAEWRIPYTDRMVRAGKIWKTCKKEPRGKLLFEKEDLKVLVFPDPETRQMAFADPEIRDWFNLCKDDPMPELPVIATVEECSHF